MRMLTLTLRHSAADALEDLLHRLQNAWKRFLANLCKRYGKLRFATVVELTHTNENGWHPHLHVLVWLPFRADYAAFHRWWKLANGASVAAEGAEVPGNVHVREIHKESRNAVGYLNKSAGFLAEYCAKGSSLLHLPAELRSEALRCLYGKRLLRTSWRFFACIPRNGGFSLVGILQLDGLSPWLVGACERRKVSRRLDGPPPAAP